MALSPVTITVLLLLLYPISKITYNVFFHPLSKVPGPRTWAASRFPFVYSLLSGELIHDLDKLHQKYGPILRIAPDEVAFADPRAWTEIMQPRSGRERFLKDALWWTEPSNKSMLNAIDPVPHARMRKTLDPAFTQSALRAQEPILLRYINVLIERMHERVDASKEGATIDIFPWLNFTTFDIFGDLGFGESFNCLQDSEYNPWISLIFNSIKAAAFLNCAQYFPLFDWALKKCIPPSLKKLQKDHQQQVTDKVRRRVNWEVAREDIMSLTLKESKNGKGMSIEEIEYTFMGLTVAGSETTATALAGILNYLSSNPDKRNTLVQEVRSTFDSETEIVISKVNTLKYLEAVIKEGLRLCPPVPWILPRRAPAGGDTVCGVRIPGGCAVSISQYAINRDPSLFHLASSFVPERWLSENIENPDSPFYHDQRKAVQPFSVGPRSCIGKNLAWAQIRLILARLLWAFDVSEKEAGALKWEDLRTFLLVEKRPIEVILRKAAVTAQEKR